MKRYFFKVNKMNRVYFTYILSVRFTTLKEIQMELIFFSYKYITQRIYYEISHIMKYKFLKQTCLMNLFLL